MLVHNIELQKLEVGSCCLPPRKSLTAAWAVEHKNEVQIGKVFNAAVYGLSIASVLYQAGSYLKNATFRGQGQ